MNVVNINQWFVNGVNINHWCDLYLLVYWKLMRYIFKKKNTFLEGYYEEVAYNL